MTVTRDDKRQGAQKIAELFAWHTADINQLDEQTARQETPGRNISASSQTRRRACDAFTAEVEDLRHVYGIAPPSGQRS